MADPTSMDDILGDVTPPEPKPEPASKAEAPAAPEKPAAEPAAEPQGERPQSRRQQARDKEMDARGLKRDPETGQFLPKEDAAEPAPAAAPAAPAAAPAAPVAPAQPEMTEREKAFLKATQEERTKRQELERRLAALEARPAVGPDGKPLPPEQPKSFWDDPEGFFAKQQETQRREVIGTKLQISETWARQRHPDFDEKIAAFESLVKTVPGLGQQMLAQADPAEFAYSTAKNHMDLQAAGSIEELRAKIERETATRVRAQVEAELKAKADELAKQRAALPPSLSEAPSKGPNRPVFTGPPSLDDILAP